jgi:hypothetical protein
MKRTLKFTVLFVFSCLSCFAQIKFQKGYFIDKKGNRTDCLIENVGWNVPPSSITYRLTEQAQEQQVETKSLSEFSVPDARYISANVRYDQSSHELKDLSVYSNPDWVQGDLLLKVIVDGTAKLYLYVSRTSILYFYSVNGSTIEQLEYKPYIRTATAQYNSDILYNRMYLSQVNSRVKCSDAEAPTWRKLPYELRPLTAHFRKFNACSGDAPEEVVKVKNTFSVRLTPGIDYTSVKGNDANTGRDYNWDAKTFFRMGIDLEFALPFRSGKWAIVAEPNFFYFKSTDNQPSPNTLEYKSIEVPGGIRHRFFLSDKTSIFINVMGLLEFPISHEVNWGAGSVKQSEVNDRGIYGWCLGAGGSFGRFSLEARYYGKRGRYNPVAILETEYHKTTLIVGFKLNK